MKVVINAWSARMGGGQTYLINLLRYLPDRQDMQIYIYAPETLAVPTDGSVTRLFTRWPTENPLSRAVWEKVVFPSVLRKLGADVLFCPGGVVGTRAPRRCKTATMFRNMIPFDPVQRQKYPLGYQRLRNWMLNRLMLQSMIQADLVIFISEHARKVIEKIAKTTLKKTAVIPHGVNPRFSTPGKGTTPRPEWLPEEYLLYVSTIDFYKAQVEVVRAYARLRQIRPAREKLLLVGHETAPYGQKVRQEIARFGLEKDVVMVGTVAHEQMPALYQHAKINIFASQSENCPNILLEALAAGRPILSSNRPPMPEFGGDAVIYFDPSSPDELAGKLVALIDDAKTMAMLSEKARVHSMRFDWETAAMGTWDAIKALSPQKD
ncbi:glycosyltransferase family 4 protein [Desulfosarcina sp.]|uniref:glycosyltransferase family 4 protein n=1 Tax=Desulfosarcina sp. TaxID=2027861 RepID=UPI003970E49D